jgi:Aspartyl protease
MQPVQMQSITVIQSVDDIEEDEALSIADVLIPPPVGLAILTPMEATNQTKSPRGDEEVCVIPTGALHKSPDPYRPPSLSPNGRSLEKRDKKFPGIYDALSKVDANLPILGNIRDDPAYAKFLKDLSSTKHHFKDDEKVRLPCGANVLYSDLIPPKEGDPGSFCVNITFGNGKEVRGMLDLGAGANLMPFSIFEKLGLGDLKMKKISLELADSSIRFSKGVIEDVLVRVGGLVVPVDFIVIDDEHVHSKGRGHSILLGRPFMATTNAIIDVKTGSLTLRVLGRTVNYSFDDLSSPPPLSLESDCPPTPLMHLGEDPSGAVSERLVTPSKPTYAPVSAPTPRLIHPPPNIWGPPHNPTWRDRHLRPNVNHGAMMLVPPLRAPPPPQSRNHGHVPHHVHPPLYSGSQRQAPSQGPPPYGDFLHYMHHNNRRLERLESMLERVANDVGRLSSPPPRFRSPQGPESISGQDQVMELMPFKDRTLA